VVLLLSGKVSEGAFTATAGGMYASVSTSWRKMTKDTDDSLEKIARALEDKLIKTNRLSAACPQDIDAKDAKMS
ncbi:MAG: hypothetical protein ACREPR_24490, partial [Brasilonema sp.]